jgi:hypothetical protein
MELHHQTKNESLIYGLNRETEVFMKLYKLITGNIERTNHKYSFFDFYSKSKRIVFELKSLTYSINAYKTAIMNTSKLDTYKHIVLIFEYTNNKNKQLYFHIYDDTRAYNKRFITPSNRLNSCEVIDIPINELTEFDPNIIYEFDFDDSIDETDEEIFTKMIEKDDLYKGRL